MKHDELVEWLFANGGPILRYRTAVELMDASATERARLLKVSLATPEARRWLANLSHARTVHGGKDTDAENALAKLLDFGFDRNVPAFARGLEHLLDQPPRMWDPFVLPGFLLRAGYADHPCSAAWLNDRIERLYQTARRGSFDFYLSPQEAAGVPKPWRGKPIYRDEFGHQAGYPVPTCYDFYALAYLPVRSGSASLALKSEAILAFLSDPRFQSTAGGYGWDRARRRCYAAGRVFLACAEPARLVLFLELGASSGAARRSEWFQQGMSALESHRTPRGTYRFSASLMAERTGNHIYGGSHMGLGEDRHSPGALELESTFRMLYILERLEN